MGNGVEISGMDELCKEIEKLAEKYPDAAEAAVKKEAKIVVSMIRTEVDGKIKGHGSRPGALRKGFKVGGIKNFSNKMVAVITSSAPHYHLVEEGHDLYTHLQKGRSGKGKIGSNVKIGEVKPKKIVAKVMAIRSEEAEEMAIRVLEEILRDL